MSKNKYLFPLIVMATLFFMFGFITTMNNSTIAFFKDAFGLNDVQKQFLNTFFYGTYALSIPVGFLINKIGYRFSIFTGLGLIALGFFASIPGVAFGYYGFLSAVSIFAVGVVILQVAAAPYVVALGPKESSASRLTLTNALNSVATVIAPIFVSLLLVVPELGEGETLENTVIQGIVKWPYISIGLITAAILVIMFFLKLPNIKDEQEKAEAEGVVKHKSSAFKYTHVWLGSLAIFVYMGIEIGIPSFFEDFASEKGITGINSVDMLKYYWGGLMVGRVLGIFILQKFKASTILTACAIGGAAMLGGAIVMDGNIAMWLFLGTGLFHSIMWPVIYSLALEDLGPHADVASGIIATSVIGAAILMPIMGGIQTMAGVIAAVSALFVYYLYLVFFATKGSKIR
ncbi:glucose/galactose MFS transporter [Carboxylicivirga linearis]|uniref:Glucose/galactose MFS transporter n=1 Tax=Carboxylicivirga linearis TaxID=1628157 RepID=A0ABS5JZQ2_9BACT|nr:glucose/galactose MFS transporter [Carboxylicivirga linearis]MBS2099969.1 glucose/galactose MFS transporter [Carboxylicivirga linearis]